METMIAMVAFVVLVAAWAVLPIRSLDDAKYAEKEFNKEGPAGPWSFVAELSAVWE